MMYKVDESVISNIETLSSKINKGTATLDEYNNYEKLLMDNGITQDRVRKKMLQYGFSNYEDYFEARKNPADRQQQKVVNIYIVAGLVAIGLVAIYKIYQLVSSENSK